MRRAFALLQAVWLAVLIAEPASLHTCAMHSAGTGGHTAHAPIPVVADEHAHHGAHHASAASEQTDVDESAATVCQCLGECCGPTTATLPELPTVPVLGATRAAAAVVPRASSDVSRAPDLKLPFANGPPTTLTA